MFTVSLPAAVGAIFMTAGAALLAAALVHDTRALAWTGIAALLVAGFAFTAYWIRQLGDQLAARELTAYEIGRRTR